MSYYEKWAAASAAIAIERGTFTHAELDKQMGPDPATLDNQARYTHASACQLRVYCQQAMLFHSCIARKYSCALHVSGSIRVTRTLLMMTLGTCNKYTAGLPTNVLQPYCHGRPTWCVLCLTGSVRVTVCVCGRRTLPSAGGGPTCAPQATSLAR
jgi:hypothetical protein